MTIKYINDYDNYKLIGCLAQNNIVVTSAASTTITVSLRGQQHVLDATMPVVREFIRANGNPNFY